ncbi:hypothetical protein CFC21_047788 [Triticum aestivum]|uniref:Uncharacterized protein n=2 Tax=Triticum aestivum TaxID=4565 RepID=A0A9R1JDX9_WHEAT|nr:uncharacterized protein LOC123100749 [Triticum aestivum]KAF7013419.1 hypothetical protein CFC21_027503 [Triticum aestivum]KAF7037418.1 hypothetical protein CFC21_047788 [Triticum aestivum]
MQRRARHGSSGELAVFGATRYFDGLADLAASPVTARQPEPKDLMIQVKAMMHHKEESYHSTQELGAKTKSNLTPFFGSSLVSPVVSFCKNPPAGIHDEAHHRVSSLSSRGSSDVVTAAVAAACGRDLGEVVGDRRLQGVRVVRGACGGEERWVVRCYGHALEEQHHVVFEKIDVDAKLSDCHQVKKVEDGADLGWGSDTSSDLFELDLDGANNH